MAETLAARAGWGALRSWTVRQWAVAGVSTVAVAAMMGLATAIIENPLFVRMIPTPWWAYPVWIASALLLGLLVGTYVAPQRQRDTPSQQRRGVGGALLALFAMDCPSSNMLVVAALGASGAVTWFQPLQPILAVLSLVVLSAALRSRLRNANACRPKPSEPSRLLGGGRKTA